MSLKVALAFQQYVLMMQRKWLREEEKRLKATLDKINRLKAQAYQKGISLD